jgi:hypothetical protein
MYEIDPNKESDLRDLFAMYALGGLLASRFGRPEALKDKVVEFDSVKAVYNIVNAAFAMADLMIGRRRAGKPLEPATEPEKN